MRFAATTRSPASSSILVTAPVRLRRVASGLMMEKVRVTVMAGRSPVVALIGIAAAPSGGRLRRQGSRLFHPLFRLSRPITALDTFPTGKQLPGKPSAIQVRIIEQVEA